jgi:hypothetical protein
MNLPSSRVAGAAAIFGVAALAMVPTAQGAVMNGGVSAAASPATRALALVSPKIKAGLDIRIAYRRYALCAASNITPSQKTTSINGRKYTLGTGLCPIVTGWTVYNRSLQGDKATVYGPTTLWSSFGTPAAFPQYSPDTGWIVAPGTGRTLTLGTAPTTAMANFWGYPCVVTTPVNISGTNYPMAMCAGPLMENIDNRPVTNGTTVYTQAPAYATIPVGLGKITGGALDGMEPFFFQPFPGMER